MDQIFETAFAAYFLHCDRQTRMQIEAFHARLQRAPYELILIVESDSMVSYDEDIAVAPEGRTVSSPRSHTLRRIE